MDTYEDMLSDLYAVAYGSTDMLNNYPVLLGGDQLTRVWLAGAKALRNMAPSPKKRFDHLDPIAFEHWHNKQDFLEKIFIKFYKTTSAQQEGSLYQLKVRLKKTDVNGKVKGRYQAHDDFAQLVTEALFVEMAQEYEHLENTVKISEVSDRVLKRPSERQLPEVLSYLEDILTTFGISPYSIDQQISADEHNSDMVYSYFSNVANWLLHFIFMKDLTKEGDVDRLLLNCKANIPFFFSHSTLSKYFIENVNFVTQVMYLTSPLEKMRVLEGAFVNLSGGKGRNIEADLAQEHEVRRKKDLIRTLGANKNEKAIQRITNASTAFELTTSNFDTAANVSKNSGWHSKYSQVKDFQLAIEIMKILKPFAQVPNRNKSGLPQFSARTFTKINREHLLESISKNVLRTFIGLSQNIEDGSEDATDFSSQHHKVDFSSQHHKGPFDKSCRVFKDGKQKRFCSPKVFVGRKANGEEYRREWLLYSNCKGTLYCFACKLFAPKTTSSQFVEGGFSDWRNIVSIDKHEKSQSHRDCLLAYLTTRQGQGLQHALDRQIKEECEYWEHVLERVIAVIRTLAERGLAFRGTEEKFGSSKNGNYLGLLELISQFDPFLAGHISKYGNFGKGNPSDLSKTICEELIELMAEKVHSSIVNEVNSSGYFSLSVDSTPDLSHVDQLSVVRYIKDGQPIEWFLAFLELKGHSGEALANQVLEYLCDVCKINFSKCRGQSYDNAANMSGRYKGMQQKIMEKNKFAIYVPCAAHSLNLVGCSAVDCCDVAVNFFYIIQLLYTFFSASTGRWKILKECLGSGKVLKSLSDTRWEAYAVTTNAVLMSFQQILTALENVSDDENQKGDTRREAENIANKMQELEFVFMLIMWDEILQDFHRTSQALQKEYVNLKTCADLYISLAGKLRNMRLEFERIEKRSKDMLPEVDYKESQKRKRIRNKQPNDGDAQEVDLSSQDKFIVSTFYVIINKLENQMRRRGEIYDNITERFSFIADIGPDPYQIQSSHDFYVERTKKLIEFYLEDLDNNFAAELQQFHMYLRKKYSSCTTTNLQLSHAALYSIIKTDKIENVFPNVDTALRIFLTLMVTNCSAERSFSRLKHLKSPNRASMGQERLGSLALLSIESDIMRNIQFKDLIKDFAMKKARRKL